MPEKRERSALGDGAAGAPAVEAAVAERDAAGVAPRRHARRAAARRIQAGDRFATDMQHLGVERGLQAAQRESSAAGPQIDRTDGCADRLQPFGFLCSNGSSPRAAASLYTLTVACNDPAGSPISPSSSATVSQTHVAGRLRNGVAEVAAMASSCASPSMIRYAVSSWW